jgi:release factor glutamine methyltransferase
LKTVLKHIVAHTYRPLLVRYLSRTRIYNFENIRLEIPPGVFHPGFFTSTHLLLKFIEDFSLEGKKMLELGAGSGLIAFDAASKGAYVTATDISPIAISALKKNAAANELALDIIQSDLFEKLPVEPYDIIAINPPYYKKDPQTYSEHAWYCGANGEYFWKLFGSLHKYMHEASEVLMVCCDGCDLPMIRNAAEQSGFELNCKLVRPSMLETNFIFKIERKR